MDRSLIVVDVGEDIHEIQVRIHQQFVWMVART